jgi:hypothetical protein
VGRSILLPTITVFALILTDCSGGSSVPVEAKLARGEKPFNPKADEYLTVNLTNEKGTASFSGNVGADGTIAIEAPDGKIPVGKYKVKITRYLNPTTKRGQPGVPIELDTNAEWDVSENNRSFTLDVDKTGYDKLDKK